ncbi:hypothetical protein ACE1CD_19715 [Aerosakkonema sp. BLCC-F183]|uniref:hypothetical protein n=1 Tax=Aerosakkonema sp. BLCC-F183 TaxID=3342834 RepID=UPI0035B7F89C
MKELLTALGGILLVFILLVLALVVAIVVLLKVFLPKAAKMMSQGAEIWLDAQNYVDSAVSEIIKDWNYLELLKRATPQFLESVQPEELERVFYYFFQQIGKLESYTGAICNGVSGLNKQEFGQLIVGDYVAQAKFTKKSAKIKGQIIKQDNQWFINTFTISNEGITLVLGLATTPEALKEAYDKKIKLEGLLKYDDYK